MVMYLHGNGPDDSRNQNEEKSCSSKNRLRVSRRRGRLQVQEKTFGETSAVSQASLKCKQFESDVRLVSCIPIIQSLKPANDAKFDEVFQVRLATCNVNTANVDQSITEHDLRNLRKGMLLYHA